MLIAVKAVSDWELDVNAVPFSMDSDNQSFDERTDIMPDAFSTPLVAYQHGIAQGAKSFQEKPIVLGKVVPGSLTKQADGWHVRVILDKAIKQARDIMEAVKRGMVAVSSGSIAHLARLDIGGKLQMYDKNKPGRIAVWPLAEISLWEMDNGNVKPANRFAYALPAMKAIYRDAGLAFPDVASDTNGESPEASHDAVKRARVAAIKARTKQLLQKTKRFEE